MFLQLLAAISMLTGVHDLYPSASPDGREMVFQSNRTGATALWISKSDGTNPRLVFDGGKIGTEPVTPSWSPDGRSIVFSMARLGSTDPNACDIYVLDVATKRVIRLTDLAGDNSHPHWSFDGKRIFFNSAKATPDLRAPWGKQWIDIYSMAADGSDLKRITNCKSICTFPWPSPDGRWVVYRRVTDVPGRNWDQTAITKDSEVFITATDGSLSRNLSNDRHFDGWPTWSPDGKWVVFTSGRDGVPNAGQVYRVHPDGSGLERLTNGRFSHAQPSFLGPHTLLVYREVEEDDTEVGGIASVNFP
jgi:TolB protein